jgi:hypothetical protein
VYGKDRAIPFRLHLKIFEIKLLKYSVITFNAEPSHTRFPQELAVKKKAKKIEMEQMIGCCYSERGWGEAV